VVKMAFKVILEEIKKFFLTKYYAGFSKASLKVIPNANIMTALAGIAPCSFVPLVLAKFLNERGTCKVSTFTKEKKKTLKAV
jgi:hypothetical protein